MSISSTIVIVFILGGIQPKTLKFATAKRGSLFRDRLEVHRWQSCKHKSLSADNTPPGSTRMLARGPSAKGGSGGIHLFVSKTRSIRLRMRSRLMSCNGTTFGSEMFTPSAQHAQVNCCKLLDDVTMRNFRIHSSFI